MTGLILFGSFAVMLLCNVSIAVALGLSSVLALLSSDMSLSMVPANYYASSSKFVLLAIPFFILGGNIMAKTGISTRLINLARSMVGHIRGGLAIVCVITSCFFAAISGSGPATVAALGAIIIPAMVEQGYRDSDSSALMSVSGTIGLIIPPSILFVVYGSITGVSISKLFMGGIIPGLIMGLFLIVACFIKNRKTMLATMPKASWHDRWVAFKDAFWGLMMPVIILGGIYGGFFTPTEAAAVSAVYGLIVSIFIYHSINLKVFMEIMKDSVKQTASVMFITAAPALSRVITVKGYAAARNEPTNRDVWRQPICFPDHHQYRSSDWPAVSWTAPVPATSLSPLFTAAASQLGYDPIALGVL